MNDALTIFARLSATEIELYRATQGELPVRLTPRQRVELDAHRRADAAGTWPRARRERELLIEWLRRRELICREQSQAQFREWNRRAKAKRWRRVA